jgi:N-acetylmuramoyl-L-alanine amidase
MIQNISNYRLIVFIFYFLLLIGKANGKNNYSVIDTKLNIVVIDPGHGGKDWGTSVSGLKEKDIVLDIGLKLGNMIKEAFPIVKVIYTRKEDVFVPLNERAKIANQNKADLFISVHANYVGVKSISGTETFVLGNHRSEDNLAIAKKENAVILLEDDYSTTYEGFDPNSSESYIMFETVQSEYLGQSLQFASFIQDQLKNKAKRPDRGVKQAGFLVLRETIMPCVLVETGFLSNEKERNYLNSDAGKSELATAVFKAFSNYKNIVEVKSTFNVNKETPELKDSIISADNKKVKPKNGIAGYDKETENDSLRVNSVQGKTILNDKIDNKKITNTKQIDSTLELADKSIAEPKKEQHKETNNRNLISDSVSKNSTTISIRNDEKSGLAIQPEKKETGIGKKNPETKEMNNPRIWFSVQVSVTTKPVKLVPDNFKGEDGIFSFQFGASYKYYKGKFDTYEKASTEKTRLRNKFTDAFLVAFEDNQPVPIKEAILKSNK